MGVMAELPSGTVSLLFSDVEGSTLLLSRLGPAYADALDGLRQVQRRAWADYGGTELGTEGDSFMVVFPTAEGAMRAAVQAQRELAAFEWPGGEQVRVRMGIHTSSPTPHDGGMWGWMYTGRARIAAAAHGGQVLLSEAIGRWWLSVCRSGLDGRRRQRPDPRPDRHGPELPSTLSTVARAKTVVGREPR